MAEQYRIDEEDKQLLSSAITTAEAIVKKAASDKLPEKWGDSAFELLLHAVLTTESYLEDAESDGLVSVIETAIEISQGGTTEKRKEASFRSVLLQLLGWWLQEYESLGIDEDEGESEGEGEGEGEEADVLEISDYERH